MKFKKLHPNAVAPKRMTEGSLGYDLTAISKELDHEYDVFSYGTGLAIEVPENYVGLIFPRSSIYKTNMSLCNAVGVIDRDYQGEITFKFKATDMYRNYNVGDRIGQLVLVKCSTPEPEEVYDFFKKTERGTGGYGSTGS